MNCACEFDQLRATDCIAMNNNDEFTSCDPGPENFYFFFFQNPFSSQFKIADFLRIKPILILNSFCFPSL